MTAILPHPTLQGGASLVLEALHVDGAPRPDLVEEHLHRLELAEESWSSAGFSARVEATESEVAALLDQGMVIDPVLVVDCSKTNLRYGFLPAAPHAGDSENVWRFAVELESEDLRDKVEIHAELAANVDHRPARRIATSAGWVLYVDSVARPPFEGTFQVRWSHFAGSERDPSIPEYAAAESFFVDLTSATPQVHLNKDLDGLFDLLDGDDTRAEVQALRDSELRRIATAAWTSAIGAAVAAIRIDDDGLHEAPATEWKADILRWSLPVIYPAVGLDEALRKIRSDLIGEDAATTHALIQLAVSQQMKAGSQLLKNLQKVAR